MEKAEEYIYKKMMSKETFNLFVRVRSVISSCHTQFQLFYALQYNELAKKSAEGFNWCLNSFIDKKIAEIKATDSKRSDNKQIQGDKQ